MPYRAWVFFHLAGAIIFFANLVAALFWRARAERTGDPVILAFTYRALNAGDLWLTTPSVALILAGGLGAAVRIGLPIVGTGWILWSAVVFGVSGLIFALRVLPLQRRLAQRAETAVRAGGFDRDEHRRQSRRWALWSHLSLLAAVAAVVLMVLRPEVPGL